MGLDNGIEVRRTKDLPRAVRAFDEEWCEKNGYDIEIAYWRKCWNVRSLILQTISEFDDDEGEGELSRDDVLKVIKVLRGINGKNYYDGAGSFWNWHEFKKFNRRNIRNLKKLARVMKRHPDISVYFYDSY